MPPGLLTMLNRILEYLEPVVIPLLVEMGVLVGCPSALTACLTIYDIASDDVATISPSTRPGCRER